MHHPPYFAPDFDLWDASRDIYQDWERIDESMMGDDAVDAHAMPRAPPPEPDYPLTDDYPYADDSNYHAARHKKKKKHRHSSSSSSTSEPTSSTSTSEETSTSSTESTPSETSTSTESTSSSSIDPSSASADATAAAQRHAVEDSSLSESPVMINHFSASETPTPVFSDDDDLTVVNKAATSYVVSTVYAVNTLMPGSYPNIDYNAIDYAQLGQIGVFADSAHGLSVASYWISLLLALMVVLMVRI